MLSTESASSFQRDITATMAPIRASRESKIKTLFGVSCSIEPEFNLKELEFFTFATAACLI